MVFKDKTVLICITPCIDLYTCILKKRFFVEYRGFFLAVWTNIEYVFLPEGFDFWFFYEFSDEFSIVDDGSSVFF